MTRRMSPTRKAPPPLSLTEKGQGCILSEDRRIALEDFCAAEILRGAKQSEIAAYLGCGRSRLSRWTKAGLLRSGDKSDLRHLRTGDHSLTQMMWHRISIAGPDDCWIWRGGIKPNGYGSLNFRGKTYNAHRLVYETLVGHIPTGLVIDHTCQNTACVNPSHLQATTQSANICFASFRRTADE